MEEVKKTEATPEGKFDTKVHVRDPKSGRVIAVRPYSLIVSQGENGEKQSLFERPMGSGIFYYENGELAEKHSREGMLKAKMQAEEAKKSEVVNARKNLEEAQKRYAEAQKNLPAKAETKSETK